MAREQGSLVSGATDALHEFNIDITPAVTLAGLGSLAVGSEHKLWFAT